MHALLELDCIPSGMEIFPATDESQWDLIKRVINDCDYYILIVGGRYGDVDSEGVSFTEKEYRYAIQVGKPIIAFLHKDPGSLSFDRSEQSEERRAKLHEFIGLVEERHCKYWQDSKDLGSVVSRSLVQLMKSRPAIGWVRANEVASAEVKVELLEYQLKIADLESELEALKMTAPVTEDELAGGDESIELRVSVYHNGNYGSRSTVVEVSIGLTWNQIFAQIGPVLMRGGSEVGVNDAMSRLLERKCELLYQQKYPNVARPIRSVHLDADDLQTIFIQFRALGLIEQPTKSQSGYCLTKRGEDLLVALRTVKSTNGVEEA